MTATTVPPAAGGKTVSRVLVVDDDRDINRLLQVRLAARGYEVGTAGDGEQALARLDEFGPDLIFLDVSMPGVGGLEVLECVRSRGLDTAVIMTTAFGSEQVAIDALRRGADDYLRKPFESSEFRAVLERTVARLELTRQNAALQRQLDEKRRELEAELARAAQVQAELLPRSVPTLPNFELAARCQPAREVGGDFHDWQQAGPADLTLTLADVMGKGMPAALLMATVRAALRTVAPRTSPAAALELAELALAADLDRSDSFVTLFHARLDATARRLSYVDAGHGHAFVRRANGRVELLSPRGLPLGVMPNVAYQEGAVQLAPGDALVLYSDGLVEASPAGVLDRDTLAAQLGGAASASELVARLCTLADGEGPRPDDLTVIVLLAT